MNQAAQAANDCADEIAHYLRTLRPLKFADIKLSEVIKPPAPAYEVVSPGYRAAPLSPATGLAAVALARRVQQKSARKKRTFGRGELKIVL